MMSDETQLNTFLLKSKNDLANLDKKTCVHVVIGNESCDLDSAVSCITYAFSLSLEVPSDSVVIPVINVHKKHFEVKTEVKFYLNHNGIKDDMLVFRDEIDLLELHEKGKLQVALVDHHVLQCDLSAVGGCVTQIVDHRPLDARAVWPSHVRLTRQLVGSCASLVGRHLHTNHRLLQDPQIAALIRGTILLDTSNFSPVTKKTTDLDREIVDICEQDGRQSDVSRQQLFDQLVAAKADTACLSTPSLLIKDMKKVNHTPIAVLTMSVKDFLDRPDAEKSLKEFSAEHSARVVLILGVVVADGNQLRDMFIYPSVCQELADKIEEFLKANTNPKLDLHTVENRFGGKMFKEINTYSTRKQILPIVERAIESYDGDSKPKS